nr:MAG TPA: hypothetical protein [Caudoviricetes sp.]
MKVHSHTCKQVHNRVYYKCAKRKALKHSRKERKND